MADFPPVTEQVWRAKLAKVLKGADFEDRLVSTLDGMRIAPLYGRMAEAAVGRAAVAPWHILQRVDHPLPGRAAVLAAEDMANGAHGLVIVGRTDNSSHGIAAADVTLALAGLPLHQMTLRVEGGDQVSMAVIADIANKPLDPARLDIAFDCADPALAKTLHVQGFTGPYMTADGRIEHGRGLSDAAELGATLARAAQNLRNLDFLPDAQLVVAVSITLAATQDMFVTLAKFRAMRLLWARLLELCKLPHAPLNLHGETSRRMMASQDAHANMLRAVASVFGAGLGGATSCTVLPLSVAQGLPNAFARRMARNAQIILQDESHLWRVHDPANGAGYVEHLTESLCTQAWDVFRSCEAGRWPEPNAGTNRVDPVIGVTSHALAVEPPAEVEAMA